MKTLKKPRAPSHLSAATADWWRSVTADFLLERHHYKLLQLACEAFDRATEAREILKRDGLVVPGREGGVRAHPMIGVERDARIAFCRCLRELDLDCEAPASDRTGPPALLSNRRGR